MNTTQVFEIEPFRFELGEKGRGRRGWRKATALSFRERRAQRNPAAAQRGGPGATAADKRNTQRDSTGSYGGSGSGFSTADTPTYGDQEPAAGPSVMGSSEYVRWLQSTLNRALAAQLPVDGVMSPSVRAAIREFQNRNRLPASGFIGPDTEAALQRIGSGYPAREMEMEFELEQELSGKARVAETALAAGSALPVTAALKSLGSTAIPGLYRFHRGDGRFYTGMATDLRRRIVQHLWCLSHFGLSRRGFKLALWRMPGATREQVCGVEIAINTHHQNNPARLNAQTELEFQELNEIAPA